MTSIRDSKDAAVFLSRQFAAVLGVIIYTVIFCNTGYARYLIVCDDVQQPPSLNPYQVFSEKVHTVLHQIFEGLVRLDANGNIEPALAERWEWMDDHTLRFYLRKNVLFHNGEPFDARSVKFSVEKYIAPETRYPGFGFVQSISNVEIIDPYTVDVKTHVRDGLILNRLAPWIHMIPPNYYSQAGEEVFARKPVGTGAFKFKEWTEETSIVLSKNKQYWMAGYPRIDGLVFRFIPAEKQLEEFLAGRIDILTELPGTATLAVMQNEKTHVVKKETFYTLAGTLNVHRGPLKDRRVRQALNYATNRQELIRYDLMGNGRPLATFSMEGEEGHNPNLKPYPYDLEKARTLLKEAGYEKGFALNALVKFTGERAAGILKAQWAKIGIVLNYEVKNEAEFMKAIKVGNIDLAFGGCPDPMAHVFFIQSISLFSGSPFSFIKVPEFDQQLQQMVSTLDKAERIKLAQKLDEFIHDQAFSVFTYQRIKTYGVKKDVAFVPHITGTPYFYSLNVLGAPDE